MFTDLLGRRIVWDKADDGEGSGGGGAGAGDDDSNQGGSGEGDDDSGDDDDDDSSDDDDDSGDDDDDDSGNKDDDLEKQRLIKESVKRKKRIRELEKQQKELKSKLDQVDDLLGDELDLSGLKEILEGHKKTKQKQLEEKGQWDQLRSQMVKEHQKETSKIKETLEEAIKENNTLKSKMEELTIGQEFSSSEFINKKLVVTPNKARIIYGDHFDMVDGQIVAYDKPRGASNRTELVDGVGEPLKFDEALQRIIDADPDKNSLLRSKKRPGGGSGTNPDANKGSGDDDQDDSLYGMSRIAKARRNSGGK